MNAEFRALLEALFEYGRNPVPEPLTAIPGRFIGALTERNYNIWVMELPN